MIVRTEAIVLSSMKYRESSRILRLYTRNFGKVSVIAKGARQAKSKFGSALQPMAYVTAVLYWKPDRDLQLLTQCDLVTLFRNLVDDIERMACGMAVVELVDAVSHAEEENVPLFELLVNTLEAMNRATKHARNALYYFEVHLLEILGFRPNFSTCSQCGISIDEQALGSGEGELRMGLGGIFCGRCAAAGMGFEKIGGGAVRVMQRMQEIRDVEAVTRMALAPQMRMELGSTLRRFLQGHIEGLRTLRSEAVFSQLLEMKPFSGERI